MCEVYRARNTTLGPRPRYQNEGGVSERNPERTGSEVSAVKITIGPPRFEHSPRLFMAPQFRRI